MLKKTIFENTFILYLLLFVLSSCTTLYETKSNKATAARLNVQLGLTYMKQGKVVRAQQKLLRALKQNPKDSQTQISMGYFLWQTGKIDQARQYYQQALHLASDDPQILNNYGVFLCQTGHYKEALNYFKLAKQKDNYLYSSDIVYNAKHCEEKLRKYRNLLDNS